MEIGTFELLKTEGDARRGTFMTAHGAVQTPVFQNVGTQGAIKGAVDAFDLKELGICTSVRVIRLSSRWAGCTVLCAGMVRC